RPRRHPGPPLARHLAPCGGATARHARGRSGSIRAAEPAAHTRGALAYAAHASGDAAPGRCRGARPSALSLVRGAIAAAAAKRASRGRRPVAVAAFAAAAWPRRTRPGLAGQVPLRAGRARWVQLAAARSDAAAGMGTEPMGLHFFSDANFRPLRDQFVGSVVDTGFELREDFLEDLGVVEDRAAGGTPVYMHKMQLLLDSLDACRPGEVLVISDVDIQFLGEVLPYVRRGIAGRDACFQREFHQIGVNIGFMALRRTDASLAFWRRVREEVDRTGGHDQRIVNNFLYADPCGEDSSTLRWARFPPEIWASSQAFDGGAPPAGAVLHHANWVARPQSTYHQLGAAASNPVAKLEQLRQVRRLLAEGGAAGLRGLAAELAADPAMAVYFSRTFGDLRSGPDWLALPQGHPSRPGRSRRAATRKVCARQEVAAQIHDEMTHATAEYDIGKSTEEIWSVPHFVGGHKDIRPLLDYAYHATYKSYRVQVQDDIIEKLCTDQNCQSDLLPWVVFTAGAMGAGKGYVVRWLDKMGYLPLKDFVVVDPDQIRQMLPEWERYVKHDPASAGAKTQKEAGHIAEILGYKALRHRYRVIFDGSLRDAKWYMRFFEKIREQFPGIRIMILHILSDKDEVIRRAEQRGKTTGRVVPTETLLASMEEVPESVRALAPYCDFCCRVLNREGQQPQLMREPDAPLPPRTVDVNWDTIKSLWENPDKNGDGELCRNEVSELLQRGQVSARAIESIDIDGDGAISKEEFRAAECAALRNSKTEWK
ncbi:unnamed protein product, partial [Prorocentrum cordatum]